MAISPVNTGGSGPVTISNGQAKSLPITIGLYPDEGTRSLTCNYDWTGTGTQYAEDGSSLVALGMETTPQAAWIDNSACPYPVQMVVNGTLQSVVIPPYSQGIVPLTFTGIPGYSVNLGGSAGSSAGHTAVTLLNVPALGCDVWQAGTSPGALFPIDGGTQSSYDQTTSAQLKVGAGRVASIEVSVVTAVGTITLNDQAATGTLTRTLTLLPSGTAAGFFQILNASFSSGLSLNFNAGATGTVNVKWT